MINSAFNFTIEIITCFLDGPLVVILTLGFFFLSLLFFAFIIFPTSSANKDGNASLIHKTSSMFDEIFILEACTYDFLILEGFVFFLVTILTFLVEDSTADVVVGEGTAIEGRVGVDTNGVVFSFGFVVVEVKNFLLVLPLESVTTKYEIYLLMVSFFSLSKIKTFHSEV